MFFRVLCRFLPLLLVLGFVSETRIAQAAGDFSIILFPDTQNEAQYFPQVLQAETQWVVNNRAALNIQGVLGLGDIVNDGASTAQQQNADSAIRTLDNAGIPYLLAIGNHDYDGGNNGAYPRLVTGFNQWFGPLRYAGKSYYKGNFPSGSNENFYGVLTINGKQYLVLVLEYIPRSTSLSWATSVVKNNPDKEIIVVTHSYMFFDNTRVDACDTQDLGGVDNNGDAVWSKFASKYPNIIMVVSGHITTGLAGRRADLGVNGNLVNQMLSNYQVLPNGGDGWLRILTFHPANNTISVKTYSPYLNAYKTDSANQFTIYYHNPGPGGTGMGKISGQIRNTTCQDLIGLTVSAGGKSAVTGSDGTYMLSLPAGQSYNVTVSGGGWRSSTKTVKVNDNLAISPLDVDFFLTSASAATCAPGTVNPSVIICNPAASAAVSSPVRVTASTTDSKTVQFMEIWADGSKLYHALGRSLDTYVTLASGSHQLTVQAYDGKFIKKTISITVK